MSDLLCSDDFNRISLRVWYCDLAGGFHRGGTSVIINLQNSKRLFIDCGNDSRSWPIKTFDEGLDLANKHLSGEASQENNQ